MLDPQLQGVAWVKERLAKKGLVCLRMGAPDMLRVLERAISEVQSVSRLLHSCISVHS
jgi:dynein heavy chain